jgi:flagellar basal body rod protein FlgG
VTALAEAAGAPAVSTAGGGMVDIGGGVAANQEKSNPRSESADSSSSCSSSLESGADFDRDRCAPAPGGAAGVRPSGSSLVSLRRSENGWEDSPSAAVVGRGASAVRGGRADATAKETTQGMMQTYSQKRAARIQSLARAVRANSLAAARKRQFFGAPHTAFCSTYRTAATFIEALANTWEFGIRLASALYRSMDALTASAASGLRARMESLDMLANNLANAGATGFKADREFYAIYADAEAMNAANAGSSLNASIQPLIDRPWTDFSQAAFQQTGNSLDVALSGPGFLTVESGGGILYTRNGALRVSAAGDVVTAEGYKVRLESGAGLRVDARAPVEIASDGLVRQRGSVIGRLEIAEFRTPGDLIKTGNSYFRSAATPARSARTEVHQGKLEMSNVVPAQSAVRLVSIMRQFEMLQRAVGIGGEMNRKAVEEVAKPNA